MNYLLLLKGDWHRLAVVVYRGQMTRRGVHTVVEALRLAVVCELIVPSSGRECVGMKGRERE